MTIDLNPTVFDLPALPDLHDPALAARLHHALDHLTKPQGALGRLEGLALQLGLILGSTQPRLLAPQVLVFAGDHGLAAQGVSAFPQAVTAQMVENFLAGGAAISVLARQHGLTLTVVDAGVASEIAPRAGLLLRKVAPGTRDATLGPAMSLAQCQQALNAGAAVVRNLPGNVLLLGEMGIGNTASAALIMARLTGEPLAQCVGRGTGLDAHGVQRKLAAMERALAANPVPTGERPDPLATLAAFGGFEIAMMCGALLEAARQPRVLVIDGFIATAALLVAHGWQPRILQRCVFSHRSDESGHARMLAHLGAQPLLDLGLRLGEGSGAALAWPLIESSSRLLCEMASFAQAGVSDRHTDPHSLTP